jgi:hypothetical protein
VLIESYLPAIRAAVGVLSEPGRRPHWQTKRFEGKILVRNQNMRKRIGVATEQSPPATSKEWLNLEGIDRLCLWRRDQRRPKLLDRVSG